MQVAFTYFLARLNVLGIFYLCLSVIVFLRLFLGLYAYISHYSPLWSCQGFSLNHDNLKWLPYLLAHKLKGLEILIAVVFCKECVLPVQGWFLFCKGGRMGGELTEGVGEQKPTLHDQNTTSNPALKTTSTQAFQEISSPFLFDPPENMWKIIRKNVVQEKNV